MSLIKLKNVNFQPDYILQIAPTCPFIKNDTVKKVIKNLVSEKSNCVVTLKRIEHEHPYRAKRLNPKTRIFNQFLKNINVEKFMSRQDLPTLFCTSGAIYGRSFKLFKILIQIKKVLYLEKSQLA